jgi:CheY-like chemotaxis protein
VGDDPVYGMRLSGDKLEREAGRRERGGGEDTGLRLKVPVPVRILLVDDDPVLLDLFADLIRGFGYQVEVVAEAGEALARLRTEPFDVLVTDILLPGMDGWQLIASAIHEQPMLRLVAMTGADAGADRERASALGVSVLQKPFRLVELRDALQKALTPSSDHDWLERASGPDPRREGP